MKMLLVRSVQMHFRLQAGRVAFFQISPLQCRKLIGAQFMSLHLLHFLVCLGSNNCKLYAWHFLFYEIALIFQALYKRM